MWARRCLPLPGRLSTVPVLQFSVQLINITLCPAFSGNLSINPFPVYPFKYKHFIKILSSSLNTMLIVDKKHCSDICCDEFPMPQIDRKNTLGIERIQACIP